MRTLSGFGSYRGSRLGWQGILLFYWGNAYGDSKAGFPCARRNPNDSNNYKLNLGSAAVKRR